MGITSVIWKTLTLCRRDSVASQDIRRHSHTLLGTISPSLVICSVDSLAGFWKGRNEWGQAQPSWSSTFLS